jgi:hypothetical protein
MHVPVTCRLHLFAWSIRFLWYAMRVRLHISLKICTLKILIILVNLCQVSWSSACHATLYFEDTIYIFCCFAKVIATVGHSKHIFIVLSLLSSAVGSQATITASFSIINQCLALNCFPRVKVIHTSKTIHGQVYIPDVNWLLMIFSLSVTIGFRDLVKIGNATSIPFFHFS